MFEIIKGRHKGGQKMKRNMKKAFACMLSAIVLMTTVSIPTFADDVQTASWWDEPEITNSDDLVDMTQQSVIEVTNENFRDVLNAGIVNTSGKYYQLTEDIVLSGWSTAENFAGTLDGNGHTITLKDNSACLLHYLNSRGTLQNIGFLGEVSNSVGDLANSGDACVVATCQGKILNCYMNMKYNSSCRFSGGLAGQIAPQTARVSNCAIQVTSTSYRFYPLAQEIMNGAKVKNCYWSKDSSDSSWGDGMRVLQSATADNCTSLGKEEMLNDLNTYAGENSVEWVSGEDGYPILKQPEEKAKYKVSFKKADGTIVNDVEKNGLTLDIKEIPASQNAGTLTLSGYDGKVAWLLSQYDDQKHSWEWEKDSNIWPGFYSGALAVKGTGEATIVAWDEDSLSHKVETQDMPDENSIELARFKVTVKSGKVEAIRVISGENEIKDGNLTVQGSEWFSLQPQIKEEGSDTWSNVPVSSVKYPSSTEDTYEANVTNKEAKFRAKKPGTFTLEITGYDQTYSINVTSEYVPITSIEPAFSGTIKVYPENYNGTGSQHNLGVALTAGTFNDCVKVTPSNASYAYNWTMESSDASVAEYSSNTGVASVVPKKVGEVTLTATSADPEAKPQVSGSSKVTFVYADEVAVSAFEKAVHALPDADKVTKEDASKVQYARFIYDHLSDENKSVVKEEMLAQLTSCEAKLNPTMVLNYKKYISLTAGTSTTKVKVASVSIKGDALKSSKSSNTNVAVTSIKDGVLKVTAKKAGTATVTVTSKEGAKATFEVRVKPANIKLNYKKYITLKAKTSTTKVKLVSSTAKYDKIVSAKSSQTSVAVTTVKDGKLTIRGKKAGTAKVTVTTRFGGTAVLTVNVK